MKQKLYVITNRFTTQTRDPSEEWDNGETESFHTIVKIFISKSKEPYTSIPVNFTPTIGQEIYMVRAQWTTGDSFGWEHGYFHEVIAIYDNYDDAATYVRNLYDAVKKEKVELQCGHKYYIPWHGFFESLDFVEVYGTTIENK